MRCSKNVYRRGLPAAACAVLFSFVGFSASAQAANLPPTISGSPSTSVYVGSQYFFKPSASDPDSKKLRFSIANKPSWASFNVNNGKLDGTPTRVGDSTNIVISVSDGVNTTSLPAFSIRVQSKSNVAPTISGTPPPSVLVGSAYNFVPTASDANGDRLTFSIANKPAWATFNSSTGQLSGTPTAAGTFASIVISTSDGALTASLPAFTITVTSPAPTNRAPTISGTPSTSATVGTAYSFRPSASDADGDTLGFSIQNRPGWATFSTSTGQLSGTPAAAGTFGNIVISVSDGKVSAALPAFTINVVNPAPPATSSATLSWTPPTQNTDGSSLTDLAGYRISYGQSPTALTQMIQISNPGISRYVIDGLQPGTYYFAVRAFASSGAESAASNVASKTIQ